VVPYIVPSQRGLDGSIVAAMRNNQQNIAYNDLHKVCEYFFGKPRQTGSSHAVFKTPWPGDPRVNIQNDRGKAKAYQVRQVSRRSTRRRASDGHPRAASG
jgi:hypothetical protein